MLLEQQKNKENLPEFEKGKREEFIPNFLKIKP